MIDAKKAQLEVDYIINDVLEQRVKKLNTFVYTGEDEMWRSKSLIWKRLRPLILQCKSLEELYTKTREVAESVDLIQVIEVTMENNIFFGGEEYIGKYITMTFS